MTTDVDRAIYETAHDFPGGVEALAAHLGRAVGTVYNKADPGCETHQFSVREAVAMMLAARDYRVARAVCHTVNHACVPLGDYRHCSDMELLNCYTTFHAEVGQTAEALRSALSRRRISKDAVARVRREIYEDIEAGLALLDRVEALADG